MRLALKSLHSEYHVPDVVITSIPLRKWLADALPPHIRPSNTADRDSDSEYLVCISSSQAASQDELPKVHAQCVPLIPGYFSGVGDIFSALLLAHFPSAKPSPGLAPGETPASHAASFALTKTQAVLRLTHAHTLSLPEDERQPTDDEKDAADPARKIKRMRGRELRIVQAQDILRGVGMGEVIQMQPWGEIWQ